MFLTGANVGLTTVAETLDGLATLPNGHVLVSTIGIFSVPAPAGGTLTGVSSDVIELDPATGAWSLYFRGSNVGLSANLGQENVDCLSVQSDGKLVLSSNTAFTANGLSGQNEDIFLFTPTALGAGTAGTFQSYYVGAAVGFTDDAVDCFVSR
jgi:hypothetical protein